MRWSKLQRELYEIITGVINIQIHCSAYPMDSQYGGAKLPRYWISLDKEIIFDYPKQFVIKTSNVRYRGNVRNLSGKAAYYPYGTDISEISELIKEYIDTPKNEILTKQFDHDHWGLVNILRAADRRIGTRRLESLKKKTHNIAALKVIETRLAKFKDSSSQREQTSCD